MVFIDFFYLRGKSVQVSLRPSTVIYGACSFEQSSAPSHKTQQLMRHYAILLAFFTDHLENH